MELKYLPILYVLDSLYVVYETNFNRIEYKEKVLEKLNEIFISRSVIHPPVPYGRMYVRTCLLLH